MQLRTRSNRANQGELGHQHSLDSLQTYHTYRTIVWTSRVVWACSVVAFEEAPGDFLVTRSHTPAFIPQSAG